jgi:hypothetical protein
MIRQTIVAAIFLAGLVGSALAGEIADLGREAEAKAAAGQHLEAVETLRRAIGVLSAQGPLAVRRVQFIVDLPKGFGLYQPRPDNVFRPGEPLIVYAEPVGMGWVKDGETNRALVLTDFEIRAPDGKVLGGQKEFGRFEFISREQNQEIMSHLTIRLTGAPPGRYVLVATYRDQVNGKSVNFELPFEIK